MSGRRVHVHIEELVLHGFPGGDRDRIAEAVRAEVASRLASPAAADRIATLGTTRIDRIDAGAAHVADAARPGREIGGALAGALTSGGNR